MRKAKIYFIIFIFIGILNIESILSKTNDTSLKEKITYNSILHQKLLIEAYKLLRHQYFAGLDIPEMCLHLGSLETGDSWGTGKMTVGAYNEDLQDVVFGYSGATGEAATMSHFWDADAGDESILDRNICWDISFGRFL